MTTEYNKEYYQKNMEKTLENCKKRFYCDNCKCYVSLVNKSKHFITQKHIREPLVP